MKRVGQSIAISAATAVSQRRGGCRGKGPTRFAFRQLLRQQQFIGELLAENQRAG